MIPPEVRRRYDLASDSIRRVADKVLESVRRYCDGNGFAIAVRPGLIKTSESLAQKLESGRYARWSDLDDLFACSIVVPTLAEEPKVIAYLQNSFAEHALKCRGQSQLHPSTFVFASTRFYGKLSPPVRPEEDATVIFEIQIRTAFEHACHVASHAIAYKAKDVDWKQQRIAAQLRASVEQLDAFVDAYLADRLNLISHECRELDDQIRLITGFQRWLAEDRIPLEASPPSWKVFAENVSKLQAAIKWESPGPKGGEWVDLVLSACGEQLDATGYDRSVPLFQFVFGCLIVRRKAKAAFHKHGYAIVLSDALLEFFPATRAITSRVDLTG